MCAPARTAKARAAARGARDGLVPALGGCERILGPPRRHVRAAAARRVQPAVALIGLCSKTVRTRPREAQESTAKVWREGEGEIGSSNLPGGY